MTYRIWLSMIENRGENLETTPSNVIIAVSGVDHFRLTTFGTSTRRSISALDNPRLVQNVL